MHALRKRRGTASVELIVSLFVIVAALQGMLYLFNVTMARQRVYSTLPSFSDEAAVKCIGSRRIKPTTSSSCSLEAVEFSTETSLTERELEECRRIGYAPNLELVRTHFRVETTVPGILGIKQSVKMKTDYAQTHLLRRE